MTHDLTFGPPDTRLPEDGPHGEALRRLDGGAPVEDVARSLPAASLPWAVLADDAFAGGRVLESYAFARTGYHRGLDSLRRAGWRGAGPVPWSHAPNRGFLRALHALGRAAAAIGEDDEAARCTAFLRSCDPAAEQALA